MIIAGGDSFVYGSELADCVHQPSRSTFTALLDPAQEYVCVAWPGYGNDAIARTVMTECEQHDKRNLAVVVAWSFPGRYEFCFSYNTGQRKSPWYSINSWIIEDNYKSILKDEFHIVDGVADERMNFAVVDKQGQHHSETIHDQVRTVKRAQQNGIAEFAKEYYKHVGGSEYWEVYSSLKEIVHLQNYLKVNNIPYLFTCADNSVLKNYTIQNPDAIISGLYNQLDMDKWFWFPAGVNPQDTCEPRGFYQWAIENKYRTGLTHPLEEAHQDAASLIKGKFDELVKKPVQ